MSWCLCDVTAVYGEAGLRKRTDNWSDAETKVIYPDLKYEPGSLPTENDAEAVPTPAGTSNRPSLAPPSANPPGPPPSRRPGGDRTRFRRDSPHSRRRTAIRGRVRPEAELRRRWVEQQTQYRANGSARVPGGDSAGDLSAAGQSKRRPAGHLSAAGRGAATESGFSLESLGLNVGRISKSVTDGLDGFGNPSYGTSSRCSVTVRQYRKGTSHVGRIREIRAVRSSEDPQSRRCLLLLGWLAASAAAGEPWRPWPFGEDKPCKPDRVIALWTDTVLTRSDSPPVRGFGGRLMFYEGKNEKPIKVEGTLVVYAFDENGPRSEQRSARPEIRHHAGTTPRPLQQVEDRSFVQRVDSVG